MLGVDKRTCLSALVTCLVLDLLLVQGFNVHVRPKHVVNSNNILNERTRAHILTTRNTRIETALHGTRIAAVLPKSGNSGGGGSFLVGKLASTLSKLLIGPAKAKEIAVSVSSCFHPSEVALLAFFGWALTPLVGLVYNKSKAEDDETDFKETYIYRVPLIIGQAARISCLVYAVDMLSVALGVMGFKFPLKMGLSMFVAKLAYIFWGAHRVIQFKRNLLCQAFKVEKPERLGKAGLYDRLLDVLIYFCTGLLVLDVFSIKIDRALSSVYALGGAGTLVFSLAARDLAAQIVNGFAIATTRRFKVGDKILLDDNTRGRVEEIDWMHTTIRGSNEVVTKIPNQQIVGTRISNLSRVNMSQVKQTVWFSYKDIDKIPSIVADIKREIGENCMMLVTDGSRPFRVHWRDFSPKGHLEVVIDTHHYISPATNAYYENRQQVLLAIAEAAKQNGVEFEIPNLALKPKVESVGELVSNDVNGDLWRGPP